MKNLLKYVVLSITVFVSNYANSASVFINLPSINLTSPTTEDFIVAEISGSYATPNFVLNSSPTIDIGIGGINITFDVSSPSGIQPFILDPFNYSVDIGQLSAGDWYVTPIFYVDGAFDSQLTTLLPLFSVTAVPCTGDCLAIRFWPYWFDWYCQKKSAHLTLNKNYAI